MADSIDKRMAEQRRRFRQIEPGKRQHDDSRPTAHGRGYNWTWRRIRDGHMRRHPLCADPFGVHGARVVPAQDVDHILPLAAGGTHEADNLQSLCRPCHNRKTRADQGARTHPNNT